MYAMLAHILIKVCMQTNDAVYVDTFIESVTVLNIKTIQSVLHIEKRYPSKASRVQVVC